MANIILTYTTPGGMNSEAFAGELFSDHATYCIAIRDSAKKSKRDFADAFFRITLTPLKEDDLYMYAERDGALQGYARGEIECSDVIPKVRAVYERELKVLNSPEMGTVASLKRKSYLQKLLAQPDEFFASALSAAKHNLAEFEENRGRAFL